MLVGFFFLACGLFLALAVMDYTIMHGSGGNYPDWIYRYWMALGLVVITVAALATWMSYSAGLPERQVPAVFFSVILLFVGGLLDLFYYFLTILKSEPYSFAVWSAQYKWFGAWGWPQQIVWSVGCFLIIAYIWHRTKE